MRSKNSPLIKRSRSLSPKILRTTATYDLKSPGLVRSASIGSSHRYKMREKMNTRSTTAAATEVGTTTTIGKKISKNTQTNEEEVVYVDVDDDSLMLIKSDSIKSLQDFEERKKNILVPPFCSSSSFKGNSELELFRRRSNSMRSMIPIPIRSPSLSKLEQQEDVENEKIKVAKGGSGNFKSEPLLLLTKHKENEYKEVQYEKGSFLKKEERPEKCRLKCCYFANNAAGAYVDAFDAPISNVVTGK